MATYNEISGSFYKVDEGSALTSFETTTGSITPNSLASSTSTTGDRQAIYTFSFSTQHDIPAAGIAEIILPTGVAISTIGAACTFSNAATIQTSSSCS